MLTALAIKILERFAALIVRIDPDTLAFEHRREARRWLPDTKP